MNDLNFEIRTESGSLCKLVREFFNNINVPPGDTASPEYQNLMKVTYRLEKLLDEAQNSQR